MHDGFTLSVQAGERLYCEPNESPYDEEGRWKKILVINLLKL